MDWPRSAHERPTAGPLAALAVAAREEASGLHVVPIVVRALVGFDAFEHLRVGLAEDGAEDLFWIASELESDSCTALRVVCPHSITYTMPSIKWLTAFASVTGMTGARSMKM